MIIEGLSLRPMNQCVGSFRNQFQYFEPSLVKTKTLTPSSRIETDWKTWSRRLSIGLAHFRSQTYFAIKKRSHARNYSASAKSVSRPTIVLFPSRNGNRGIGMNFADSMDVEQKNSNRRSRTEVSVRTGERGWSACSRDTSLLLFAHNHLHTVYYTVTYNQPPRSAKVSGNFQGASRSIEQLNKIEWNSTWIECRWAHIAARAQVTRVSYSE